MADFSWLAREANVIHQTFTGLFYGLVTVFLLLGIFLEYFKWPLGGVPSFGPLIGRTLIAAILLHTFPEVINAIADFSDGLSHKLGDLNQFNLVRARMGDKLHEFSFSILSVKESVILLISFLGFFLLYFTVHVADAFLIHTWTLLYVFSPLLIALYVLPATAGATKALYRSLIEVASWKVVWSVLASLLWSAALSDINKPGHDISFLSAVCYDLILASSLLLTPVVVHNLAGSGLATFSRTIGGIAIGASMIGPAKLLKGGAQGAKRAYNGGHTATNAITSRYFPRAHEYTKKMPRINVPQKPPIFQKSKDK